MTTSVSRVAARSPITVAAGFLGAFIVGSLAVQLVRSYNVPASAPAAGVDPVIASPATLWSALGERDLNTSSAASRVKPAAATARVDVKPVIGSEATLWSSFGER